MKDNRPRCKACRFWDDANNTVGYCRRRAPTANHLGNPTWVMTSSHSWCGEHEPSQPNHKGK